MTAVRHRFAEIHQADEVIKTDKLWSALTSNELSGITVSSVCQKIIRNVETGLFQFNDTLLHLQNLLLTCTDRLKTSVFFRTISVLLQHHGQKTELHNALEFTLTSTTRSSTTTAQNMMVHPFITICRQRPELCDDVFFEVDFLLSEYNDHQYTYSLLDTLGIFFDSILLTSMAATTPDGQKLQQKALLGRFSKPYPSTTLRIELYYYLVNVIERFPTRRAMSFYLELIDFVMAVFTSPELPEKDLKSIATILFYQLLCRAYDGATYGYPALPYLQRLQRIYDTRDICSNQPLTVPNFYLTWPSYSYLLITAQTVDDQNIVLELMQKTIYANRQNEAFDNTLLTVAMLPLFQTWTEIVDDQRDLGAKQRKILTLDILSHVSTYADSSIKEKLGAKENITGTLEEFEITGTMAHMIPFLLNFIDGQLSNNETTPISSVSHIHTLIFTTPHVFSNNTSTRHSSLDRITQLSSINTGQHSFKFPVFLLIMYLMRSKDIMTSETFLHTYQMVIPSLVDTNDPITTTKILQTVLPMIHGGYGSNKQGRDTIMAAIGFKTLVKIYEQQPRVWHEVKKAMANWILHRKSTMRSDDTLSIQMELAILTSMRDLCTDHPRTCAQDILPMAISLLQSCNDLNVASLALIVSIMCACVNAGLAEPRSLWNVSISYIASFAMEHPQKEMVTLWTKICDFFAIVGDANEVSESYYEFKEDILFNYLEPLISSDYKTIRSSALSALAHFPADDMLRLLPEKAKQFTDEIIAAPDDAQITILGQLLSHELDHMRRNLFKEDTVSNKFNSTPNETSSSLQREKLANKEQSAIGEKEAELTDHFVKTWEQAGMAPGVRTGYTIAVLHASNSHVKDCGSSASDSMSKAKWYRCMTTSIGDIALTDHLLVRISCLSGWISLFETVLGQGDSTLEVKSAQKILHDLLARLEKSTVPGTTCNTLLALTGFVLTAHRLEPSFGVSCATQLIDILCSKYIIDSQLQITNSNSNRSTLVTSDEVQFAASICLGHIAGCIVSNEKLATQLLDLMLNHATNDCSDKSTTVGRAYNNIDTAVDLTQFARGYAAAIYTAALVTWPTKTHIIDNLAKNGSSKLLQYLNATSNQQRANESRTLGIMMGWASKIQSSTDMHDVCCFALETLKSYSEQGLSSQLNKGNLLGSCWVAAYSAIDDNGNFDTTTLDILQKATDKASNDIQMTQHYYHFSVSLAHLNRTRILHGREAEHSKSFGALLRKEIKIIKENDANAATTSILSLGSLLGVDYLSVSLNIERLASGVRAYSNEARNEALDTLGYSAGVLSGSLAVGNLKNTRIAAVVCGKINNVASTMCDTKILQDHSGNSEAAVQLLLNASTEPKSYSRLNNNTSFLRAVFDCLTEHVNFNDLYSPHIEHSMGILLSSLCDTPGPLPPVNWFPLLNDISKVSNRLNALAIKFASHHAATSMSLTEYIISQLSESHKDRTIQELLASKTGFGKVFELSGLPDLNPLKNPNEKRRGMDAVTKKTSISEMRCIEIFEMYIKTIKVSAPDIQLMFLTTLSDHLPPIIKVIDDEHIELLVNTLRDITYFNITLPLLHGKDSSQISNLIQKAIECSVKDSEQIYQQDIIPETANAHCIAIFELCRLRRTTTVTPIQLIIDTIRRLLIKKIYDDTTWYHIANAVLQIDCESTKQKLAWVTRILDTLIVIGSRKNPDGEDENPTTLLVQGLANGLRHVLLLMWWNSGRISLKDNKAKDLETTLPDTRYMFAHIMYLSNQHPQEQQQIVKRILKLTILADSWGSENQLEKFFTQVIRDSPEQAITSAQNYDQIAQIIVSE
ncbi:hypothetical protein BDA99DRAFT_544199 [Phascolomyces articulosus]|uniref:DUF3730 domain-containing protein n=1 Tax=Phascolomyces articulosus TaxID=60185 RepID=A0AAD5JVN4_9FUNG|nr:hypothetical protein BDA99DRAFT_544199 [Phascolomyces articulosus]